MMNVSVCGEKLVRLATAAEARDCAGARVCRVRPAARAGAVWLWIACFAAGLGVAAGFARLRAAASCGAGANAPALT